MSVITISREFGASGTYIALKTASALGYTCYDQQILNAIAEKMGKDKEQIEPFDQSCYNRLSVFVHDALESISKGGMVFHPFGMGTLDWDSTELFSANSMHNKEKDYIEVLTQVIKEIAEKSDAIIMGRGGSQILKNRHKALHVRIIANMEEKLRRISEEQNISEADAKKLIDAWETTSKNFIYDYFDADIHDPHHYHLVLNTSLLSPDACINLLVNTIKSL
jgi:cytidylate kinase